MKQSLGLHNQALRESLATHRGYEVKTQGDSFFVTFCDRLDGVQWCLSVQELLVRQEWPEALLEFMRKKDEKDAAETRMEVESGSGSDGGSADSGDIAIGPGDMSAGRVSLPVWRGLRVRIGGTWATDGVQVETDPGSKKLDYFGPAVNRAARISSMAAGGQILFDGPTLGLLKGNSEGGDVHVAGMQVRPLGRYVLRGLQQPVDLVEVKSQQLQRRLFRVPSITSKGHAHYSTILNALPLFGLRQLKEASKTLYSIWTTHAVLPPWLSPLEAEVDSDPTLRPDVGLSFSLGRRGSKARCLVDIGGASGPLHELPQNAGGPAPVDAPVPNDGVSLGHEPGVVTSSSGQVGQPASL